MYVYFVRHLAHSVYKILWPALHISRVCIKRAGNAVQTASLIYAYLLFMNFKSLFRGYCYYDRLTFNTQHPARRVLAGRIDKVSVVFRCHSDRHSLFTTVL